MNLYPPSPPPKKNERLFKSKPGGYNLTIWAALRIYQPQEIHGKNQPCHTQPHEANRPDSLPEVLLFVDVEIMSYTLPKFNSENYPWKMLIGRPRKKKLGRLLFRVELLNFREGISPFMFNLTLRTYAEPPTSLPNQLILAPECNAPKAPPWKLRFLPSVRVLKHRFSRLMLHCRGFRSRASRDLHVCIPHKRFIHVGFSWREKKGNYVFS